MVLEFLARGIRNKMDTKRKGGSKLSLHMI
jgi:hypothetical protein